MGTLSAIISGQTIPLLTAGLGTTSITTLVNQGLSSVSGSSLQVAGTTFTLDSIQLNSSGPEIQLQGSIALPIGVTVAVNNGNDVNISRSGVSLTGVSASLSGSFSLAGATFDASQLQVAYTPASQTFAITGQSSIIAGKLGTIGLDLGGGSTQGVVITNGALSSLDATASLDATLAGGTLTATDADLVYQPAAGATPPQLALSGSADLKIGSDFDLSLALGTSSSPGLLIQGGAFTSLVASASLNTTLAGATFSASNVNVTYVSASDSFSVSGSATLDFPRGPDLSLMLGTPGDAGLVFSGGALTSLDATANFSMTLAGATFSASNVNVTYVSVSDSFSVSGSASLNFPSGPDLTLTFGTQADTGLVFSSGALTSLDAAASFSMTLAGATFAATDVNVSYVSASDSFSVSGSADLKLTSGSDLSLTLGSLASPGLVLSGGALSRLNATASIDWTLAGATFSAANVNITYASASDSFSASGSATLDFPNGPDFSLTLGSPASPGLVLSGGALSRLDATASIDWTLAGATFSAANVNITYASASDSFSASGSATLDFPNGPDFSLTLGSPASPGLVLSGGALSRLDATTNLNATIAAVAFSAAALNLTYAAAKGSTPDQFTLTGDASLSPSIGGSPESIAVDLGGGSTQGLVLSGGKVTSLNMTVTSSLVVANASFDTAGLIITDNVSASGNVFTITGDSDLSVGGVGKVDVDFGGPDSQGLIITNGTLSSLNMTVTSSLTIGGVAFTTSGLLITENVSTNTFTMTGAATLTRGIWPTSRCSSAARASNGNAASTGLVITNGSLSSLDMSVNSTITEAGVTLTADGLHLVYNATPSPATFSLSGNTTAAFPGLGNFSTTLGTTAHPSGLVIQEANLVSLGLTITSAMSIDGVTFSANNLAFDYTASSKIYQMTGTTGAVVSGIGGLQVTLGTSSQPNGLVVQNGSLTALGVVVDGNFTIGGVTFTAEQLDLDYTATPQTFQLEGTSAVNIVGMGSFNVTFANQGILIQNGTLEDLDVAVNSNLSVDGVTFTTKQLEFDYTASPQTFQLIGTAGVSITGLGSLSVTFGTPSHPQGILIQNGTLEDLDVAVNSNLSVDGVTFTTKQLEFDYTASPQTFQLIGTAGVSISGMGSLSVTFANQGLVIQNGTLEDLDVAVNSNLSVDGVTFTTKQLEFDYTASPQTFQLIGTAGVSITGLGSLSVTFGTPSHPQGILIQNGTLEDLDVAVNSNLSVDGVTFTTKQLEFDYTASPQTFQLIGTAGVSITGLGSLSVTFGTPSHPQGILIQNGTLEDLDVSVTSNFTVDGLTFYTQNLEFDYTANPQTFQLTGTAGVIIGGISSSDSSSDPGADSFSVTFGGPKDSEGILITNGTLISLDATINASFWVDGVEIYAKNLEFAYLSYDSATGAAAFLMAGTVGAALPGGIGIVNVTFGSNGDPGLVISHDELVSLDMTIAASFGVGGLTFAKGDMEFTYTASTDEFTMTGTTSFDISIGVAVDFNVDFGGNGTQGLIIQNGQLISLNMQVTSNISVGNITLTQGDFVLAYTAAASEFIMTGDATLGIPDVVSFKADLGGNGTQGLVIERGQFESLNLSVGAQADYWGLDASLQVTATYSASTGVLAFGGTAGLSLDTGVLPSWVKSFFDLPANLSLGSVGFYIYVPTNNVSSGYSQFWVTILGEQMGLEVGFNHSVEITLGNGIAGDIRAIAEDASKAYEATEQALASAYLAAADGVVGAYNVTVTAHRELRVGGSGRGGGGR